MRTLEGGTWRHTRCRRPGLRRARDRCARDSYPTCGPLARSVSLVWRTKTVSTAVSRCAQRVAPGDGVAVLDCWLVRSLGGALASFHVGVLELRSRDRGRLGFCPHCGAERVKSLLARELRKTVTVLFCDVTGSTALGESLDPEALRGLLARYFERMRAIVERYGGTVEKFIGDAVMAVFGVPVLHEDDALRAVRAAAEMRDALPGLGLQGRIGLTSGEVVTGTEERLATGDAVNVAARLQQAAAPPFRRLHVSQRCSRLRAVVRAAPPSCSRPTTPQALIAWGRGRRRHHRLPQIGPAPPDGVTPNASAI